MYFGYYKVLIECFLLYLFFIHTLFIFVCSFLFVVLVCCCAVFYHGVFDRVFFVILFFVYIVFFCSYK